jgi:hypothetical protein
MISNGLPQFVAPDDLRGCSQAIASLGSRSGRRLVGILALCLPFAGQVGCSGGPRGVTPSLPSPSAYATPGALSGHLVLSNRGGEINALSLRTLEYRVLVPRREGRGIHAIAGPSGDGTVLFVDDIALRQEHAVMAVSLAGGGPEQQFVRAGGIRNGGRRRIGSSLAITADGKRAALLSDLKPVRLGRPSGVIDEGTLELWVLRPTARRTEFALRISALDAGLDFSPDGGRLVYVTMVAASATPGPSEPAVREVDLATGASRELGRGRYPVVSSCGRFVVFQSPGGWLVRVDLRTGRADHVSLPGRSGRVIAVGPDSEALYWADPAAHGERPRRAPMYSPVGGRKWLSTICSGSFASTASQLVLGSVDPRQLVSYGPQSGGSTNDGRMPPRHGH